MKETPHLDDFGREIKYSRWDGTQRLDALEAEELLSAMSDELLSGGDLEDAMARLSRWGIPGRMEGMKDLLEKLRSAKQRRAQRHDLSTAFDQLKQKLEEVKTLEREGLERRRAAEAPNEQLRQAMERLAQERLAQLEALPEDFGRAVRALKDYEFVEPKAAEKYQELMNELQKQVLGSYFKNMRESLQNLTPEQLERTRQMIRDLNRALKERMDGGEPDFEAFQRQYPELAGTLGQLMPMDGYDHAMSGDEPLTLAEALGLMDEMNQISDMEDTVRGARNSDDLESLDRDQVERLAGPSAKQALDELRRMTELLEEAGLIRKDGERYELTPRGIRKIGQRSLEEIFATLKRDAFGSHRAQTRARFVDVDGPVHLSGDLRDVGAR